MQLTYRHAVIARITRASCMARVITVMIAHMGSSSIAAYGCILLGWTTRPRYLVSDLLVVVAASAKQGRQHPRRLAMMPSAPMAEQTSCTIRGGGRGAKC